MISKPRRGEPSANMGMPYLALGSSETVTPAYCAIATSCTLRDQLHSAAEPRRVDGCRSHRDDGGYHADPSTRREPAATSSHQDPAPCQWFARLAGVLDRRSVPWLIWLFLGAV